MEPKGAGFLLFTAYINVTSGVVTHDQNGQAGGRGGGQLL